MKSCTHELQPATSTNVVASKSQAQQRNSAPSGPSSSSKTTSSTAPGGWLALSVASGNLGGLSDDGESHLVGNGTINGGDTDMEDTATQTDDVVIVEAKKSVSEQTASKNPTKSKLPPWAKPWSKPAAPAVADPDSTSPSSVDNRQAPNVGEDKAINAGGASSGGGGGLDWISAAVDNGTSNLSHDEKDKNAPTNRESIVRVVEVRRVTVTTSVVLNLSKLLIVSLPSRVFCSTNVVKRQDVSRVEANYADEKYNILRCRG